jgi:serine/threonine protein kinase
MTLEKIKILGKGGFGVVYLVKNKETNKLYALKKTHVQDAISYNNEINILKKLNHKNVVKIYDNYKTSNYYNILLEYVDNGTLENKINYKFKNYQKFSYDEIKNYIIQVTDGLEYIHTFNIIHRDIKPGNLLINKENILKIVDFGVSREYDTMEYIKTFIGTPYYLAPEMISGIKYDIKVDYWALGCIFYELLTLKKPFNGNGMYSIINKINKGSYNLKNIPDKYKDIIKNLLNKNTRQRYNYIKINEFFYPLTLPKINNSEIPEKRFLPRIKEDIYISKKTKNTFHPKIKEDTCFPRIPKSKKLVPLPIIPESEEVYYPKKKSEVKIINVHNKYNESSFYKLGFYNNNY